MTAENKSKKQTALTITVVLAVIVFYGLTFVLWSMTLVSLLTIIIGSLFLAALSGLPLFNKWSVITGTKSLPVNIIFHLVIATGVFMSIILGINFLGRNVAETKAESVNIVRVYSEEHHRSRRVGRRYITNGEVYKVYYIDVELPGGYEKALSISPARFRNCHKGDSVTVKLTPGALGMTIVGR